MTDYKPGDRQTFMGQGYVFTGQEPYTTKSGEQIMLDCWQTHCADCGVELTVKTSARSQKTAFVANRRCAEHKWLGRAGKAREKELTQGQITQ